MSNEVWIDSNDAVAIPTQAYGINNDMRVIPEGKFDAFDAKMKTFGYTLMRYPGGWDSEWYNWATHTTPGWNHEEFNNQPPPVGARPEQVLARTPATFVLRTQDYVKHEQNKLELGACAVGLVNTYKGMGVTTWEIGNEWFLMGGQSSYDNAVVRQKYLDNYIEVAKHIASKIKSEATSADVDVYVNGDWVKPDEFAYMRAKFGDAWKHVDGVALHVYAGDDQTHDPTAEYGSPQEHHIRTIQPRIKKIKEITGLNKVYVSEWVPSRAYTKRKLNLQAANVQIELMWNMLRAGITAATLWPAVDGVKADGTPLTNLVGLNFTDATYTHRYPTGEAFAWMAQSMVGHAVGTAYDDVPAAAARDGNTLVVFLLGHDMGKRDVTVHVRGYTITSVVSADVMYSSAPAANQAPAIADIKGAVSTNPVRVTINPEGTGRGSSYEIIRLVFNGVVEPEEPLRLSSIPAPVEGIDSQSVHVFWQGSDGSLRNTRYYGDWPPTTTRPSPRHEVGSAPAPIKHTDGNVLAVFWRGTNNNLWDTWYQGADDNPLTGWLDTPFDTNNNVDSRPAPLFISSEKRYVFWKGKDGCLWSSSPVAGTATDWAHTKRSTRANVDSRPAPVKGMFAADLHVFWRGTDGYLWHVYFNEAQWSEYQRTSSSVGVKLAAGLAPAPLYVPGSDVPYHVFWKDENGFLWDTWYGKTSATAATSSWNTQKIDTKIQLASEPAPYIRLVGPDQRVRVFFKGADGSLYVTSFSTYPSTATTVRLPAPPNVTIDSGPAPLYDSARDQLHLFWKSLDDRLWDTMWDGAAWTSSQWY